MKLKLIIVGLVTSLLTFNWAVEPKSPTNFPAAKHTDPMMLIWPSVNQSKQDVKEFSRPDQGPTSRGTTYKKQSKKIKKLSHRHAPPTVKIKAYRAVQLSYLLMELSEEGIIPPVMIGNPNESTWYNRVTMSVPIKFNLKVLESLAELYGFMITENKHGMIVLSAKTTKINVNFQFVSAYNALRAILKDSTDNYVISPTIVKLKRSLSLNLKDYTVHNALYVVAEAFDLKIRKGKGGALIIEPKYSKVSKVKKTQKKRKKSKSSKKKD